MAKRKKKEIVKKLRKKIKNNRSSVKIVFDPELNECYQPHAILRLWGLDEKIALPIIAYSR